MKRQGNLGRRRFDSMNAPEAPHQFLKRKRPPVFSYRHDLAVENEGIACKIGLGNPGDFRNASRYFREAPAPDADLVPVFVNLDSRPVVLELQRCLSAVDLED